MDLSAHQASKNGVAPWSEATAAPVSSPLARVANIDRLRILAAVGIVWFHTQGASYRQIAYAGLPIFLLIFFSLITVSSRGNDARSFVKHRWNRLLKPWLFWSVIYGLGEVVRAIGSRDADSLRPLLSLGNLLIGTHIHLWYLPYAFLSGFVIYGLNRWTRRLNAVAVIVISAAVGALVLTANATGQFNFTDHLAEPLPQWLFGLAAIPLGFAIGSCLMLRSRQTRQMLLCAICITTLVTCMVVNFCGFTSATVPYGIAIVLVCLAYVWPYNRRGFLVVSVAPLTFGIYLIHPLISYAAKHMLVASQHPAVVILITTCLSGLAVLALKRTPLRRFV